MNVVVWITEGSWPACVDAARVRALDDEQPVLLHVSQDPAAPAASAEALLDAAADRLGRGAEHRIRHGRPEDEVVREASGAELLVCARDNGTRLAPSTRYIVEHAPCPVLLV